MVHAHRWVLLLISSTSPFTSSPSSLSLWSPCSSCCPTTSTSTMWWTNTLRTPAEDLGTLAENEPPIGKTLLDACRRRADHSAEKGLSSCLSSSVSHDGTGRPVVCSLGSQVSSVQETQRHTSEREQIRTLLERHKEQILADCQAEIRKHEFQADYDRRSIQKWNETIESQKEEICRVHQGDEQRRQDHQLLHEQLLNQNWDLREAHEKSLSEMDLRGENWSKIEILSLNSLARYRNCRMKSIVCTIREIFKMLNQNAVDILTLPVNLCLSHFIQFLVEC